MPEWVQGKWSHVSPANPGEPITFEKYVLVQGNLGYEAYPAKYGRGQYTLTDIQADQATLQVTWENNPFDSNTKTSSLVLKRNQDLKTLSINGKGPFTR